MLTIKFRSNQQGLKDEIWTYALDTKYYEQSEINENDLKKSVGDIRAKKEYLWWSFCHSLIS